MTTPFFLRADTTARWQAANPVLGNGEPGVEIVSINPVRFKLKTGNGVTAWNDLGYSVGGGGGATGPSAYDLAVAGGFVGTQAAWLASLRGAAGSNGTNGTNGTNGAKGDKGDTGAAGTGGDPTLGGTYGGDSSGATYSDSALIAAKAAGVKRLRAEAGTFKFANKMLINSEIDLYGDGPNSTFFDIYTTTDHGMEVAPASAGSRTKLRDFTLRYKGAGQAAGKHGLLVKRKVFADNIVVQDFTGSGIRFDSYDGTVGGAVFFSVWNNCRSTGNGLDGLEVRFGANANRFVNFLGDKNGRYGVHHYTDGGATYANSWDGGQCSYNVKQGWFMESGTDIKLDGIYGEYNCSPDNTNNNGYTNTDLSTTDRRVDFHFGDGVNRVKANLSAVLNNDSSHVRVPSASNSYSARIDVAAGGLRYTPLAAAVSTSTATTLAGLLADHNALVTALKNGKLTG